MKNLILHPTDTSQWHALVYEAQVSSQLILAENTESYLVFLLMRFTLTTQLVESVISMDFLESLNATGRSRVEKLQEVGDKSLLLCGLFPDIAIRRHVGLNYFSEMGQAAYLTASELQAHHLSPLYVQLSEQFITLRQVLQAMRTGVSASPD